MSQGILYFIILRTDGKVSTLFGCDFFILIWFRFLKVDIPKLVLRQLVTRITALVEELLPRRFFYGPWPKTSILRNVIFQNSFLLRPFLLLAFDAGKKVNVSIWLVRKR